jgi:DNA-binding transcriptional MocR family regulator
MDSHELMITTGSLQAIYIFTYLMANRGESILTENPSFIGSLSLFHSFDLQLQGVGLDEDGILMDELEAQTARARIAGRNLKFLYLIPNFHNPAGIIYSPERRRQVLDYIAREKIMLLEDDPYNELYFNEEDKPLTRPILAMADEEVRRQIVYVGSFSKILGPGFRLGWMVMPKPVFRYAELLKQSLDACSPNLSQIIANAFMRQGYMERYLERIRPQYKLRKDLTIEAMRKYFPPEAQFVEPRGGFYVWVTLPEGVDAQRVLDYSIRRKVVFVLGKSFDPAGRSANKFRVAFSNVNPEDIEPAIRIIGEGIRQVLKEQNPSR